MVSDCTSSEFASDSTGGARIIAASEKIIRCEYDKEKAYISYDDEGKAFVDPAGMSGGPVFICWPDKLATFNFVGFVQQAWNPEGKDFGTFSILPASFLKADGTISI